MSDRISVMGVDGVCSVGSDTDRVSYMDEVGIFSAEQIEAAVSKPMRLGAFSFGGFTLSIDGKDYPISNVSLTEPELEIRSPRDYFGGWSGTMNFTTTVPKPGKPWAESQERQLARLLNAPTLLPEGPQREAEVRRARRRARNIETVRAGGMIPDSDWPWSRPLWFDPAWVSSLPMVPYR